MFATSESRNNPVGRGEICTNTIHHTHQLLKPNIVIDDKLLADAIQTMGGKTKQEVMELGLTTLVKLKEQESLRGYRDTLHWSNDLDRMRSDSRSTSTLACGRYLSLTDTLKDTYKIDV